MTRVRVSACHAEIEHGHVERLGMRRRMCLVAELMSDIGCGGDGGRIEVPADQRSAEFPCAGEYDIADEVVPLFVCDGIGNVSPDEMLIKVGGMPFRAEAVKAYDERGGGGKSARAPWAQ